MLGAGLVFIDTPLAVVVGAWLAHDEDMPPPPSPTGGGPRMVRIPGGTVLLGSDSRLPRPRLQVTLPEFEMDETEVTVDQYARCVDAEACRLPIVNEAGGDELVDEVAASDGQRHQARSTFPWNDGFPLTAPVASFPKGRSPFGLYDMAGNVDEHVTLGSGPDWATMGGDWALSNISPLERRSGTYRMATSTSGIRCARSVGKK